MAYVITSLCSKNGACIGVCPRDAIHPKPADTTYTPGYAAVSQLYINPAFSACNDCAACVTACPNQAIFSEF